MKFTFKYQYQDILARGFDMFGKNNYTTICTGGSFLGDNLDDEIKLTPYYIIKKYKDWTKNCLDSFLKRKEPITTLNIQKNCKDKNTCAQSQKFEIENSNACLGNWTKEMENEKDVHIYYFIQDNMIYKMIIYKIDDFSIGNVLGCDYLINLYNKMISCTPEEGDVIYDNYKDAKNALKKRIKKQF